MLHPSICQKKFGTGQNLLDKQLDLVPWEQLKLQWLGTVNALLHTHRLTTRVPISDYVITRILIHLLLLD